MHIKELIDASHIKSCLIAHRFLMNVFNDFMRSWQKYCGLALFKTTRKKISFLSKKLIVFSIGLFIFTLLPRQVRAVFPDDCANGIFIGPEFYFLEREREGGTHQDGMLFGGRIGYERLKRYHWYLGVDALYAGGTLEGESSSGKKIKSELTDTIVEGRLGFTFQYKTGLKAFITPFVGGGYFHEINDFVAPTPLQVKFTDTFKYVTGGALTGIQFANHWNLGLNFKLKWMLDGKCKVSNDPDFDELTLLMENEFQYRFETPISYQFNKNCMRLEAGLIPFFEYRHFGGRANFPFDFIDTKFQIWGARFEIAYRF